MEKYICAICGRENVKLWRPVMGTEPLICATCLEERQTPTEYEECTWKKCRNGYVGTPTGRKLLLDKWTVDEKGKIPSYHGPGPNGLPNDMTDQLVVNLKNDFESYASGETSMLPAVPNKNGGFWGYTAVPKECCEWWENLPTR